MTSRLTGTRKSKSRRRWTKDGSRRSNEKNAHSLAQAPLPVQTPAPISRAASTFTSVHTPNPCPIQIESHTNRVSLSFCSQFPIVLLRPRIVYYIVLFKNSHQIWANIEVVCMCTFDHLMAVICIRLRLALLVFTWYDLSWSARISWFDL